MRAKYALKALICMAQQGHSALSSKQIADAENIPHKFLTHILQELRQNGIVDSKRGVFGGFVLSKHPSDIFLGDVIRVIDGPLAPIRCVSLTAYQKCEDCADEAKCHLHHLMLDVRKAMTAILDGRCLEDLITCQVPA